MIDLHIIRWGNFTNSFNVFALYRWGENYNRYWGNPPFRVGELYWAWCDCYGSIRVANHYYPNATFKETDKPFEQYEVPFDEEDLL